MIAPLEQVEAWAHGRSCSWRAILLLYIAYTAGRLCAQPLHDPLYSTWFDPLTLAIHEGGHLFFGLLPLGQSLVVAGGTIFQLAAPIATMVMFWRQPDYFAVGIGGAWLATSLFNVAVYMNDAPVMELPLVSIGGDQAGHDWNTMLDALGVLASAPALASAVRAAAVLVLALSLAWGAWTCWLMARHRG